MKFIKLIDANCRAIYYRTGFMLQKHYRNRVLTTHYMKLVGAADAALAGGYTDDLRHAVEESKKIIGWHGYKKKHRKARICGKE
jgi:hypothetical protein